MRLFEVARKDGKGTAVVSGVDFRTVKKELRDVERGMWYIVREIRGVSINSSRRVFAKKVWR